MCFILIPLSDCFVGEGARVGLSFTKVITRQNFESFALSKKTSWNKTKQLAARCRSYYQHLESGWKKFLRIDTIERICRAYGIEVWEFFYTQLPQLHMDVKKGVKSNMHRGKASK